MQTLTLLLSTVKDWDGIRFFISRKGKKQSDWFETGRITEPEGFYILLMRRL
jgi:hypothetical protein